MKRTLIATTLAVLLQTNALVVLADDYEEPISYEQEWQGMGIGALVGAIAAGPPGLVIGVAGGALIGRHEGLEADLKATRDALERQSSEQELKLLEQTRRLEAQRSEQQRQLEAIVQGFRLNIHFRTESAELEPRFVRQLESVASLLEALPEVEVHIDAFADRRGMDGYNQELSERRARVVARRLEAAGVEVNRIHQIPHGERQAEYPLNDAEGMDFDRRVLLYFSRRSS